jgi:hypothetical protein
MLFTVEVSGCWLCEKKDNRKEMEETFDIYMKPDGS